MIPREKGRIKGTSSGKGRALFLGALIFLMVFTFLFPWWHWSSGQSQWWTIPGYFRFWGIRHDAVYPWGVAIVIEEVNIFQILFFETSNIPSSPQGDLYVDTVLLPYRSLLLPSLFVSFVLELIAFTVVLVGEWRNSLLAMGLGSFLLLFTPIVFIATLDGISGNIFWGLHLSLISSGLVFFETYFVYRRRRAYLERSRKREKFETIARERGVSTVFVEEVSSMYVWSAEKNLQILQHELKELDRQRSRNQISEVYHRQRQIIKSKIRLLNERLSALKSREL